MAGLITTGSLPQLLWPGLNGIFGQVYKKHSQQWERLYDTRPSDMNYERQVQVVDFGLAPEKPEGQSTYYDSEVQGYTATWQHVAYSLGYLVTREEMDDNLYAKVAADRTRNLAFSIGETKENVGAALFNNAFSSSFPGADGSQFIGAAHNNTSGGTFSNRLAVDANFSEAALEDLCIQIMQTTNDRGLQVSLMPKSLHVHPANSFNAQRVLKSLFQTGTANNDINVIATEHAIPQGAHVNNYFTNPSAWFVRTSLEVGGLIHFERTPVEFRADNDFDNDTMKFKGYERYSFNYADPRCCYGTSGA